MRYEKARRVRMEKKEENWSKEKINLKELKTDVS